MTGRDDRARGAARRAMGWLREDPWVLRFVVVFAVLQTAAAGWDLPHSWSWEVDAVAPRELFAGLADNLVPGRSHRYPLLHYVLIAIPSLPFVLYGFVTADHSSAEALEWSMVRVPVMTGVTIMARLVTVGMGALALVALAHIVRRTMSVRAGRWAVVFAALNLSFSYYARTANLDVPYLMWTVLAMAQLLLVAERGRRSDYFVFAGFCAAAVGTKDQAYASIVLPGLVYFVALPALSARPFEQERPHWRRLFAAVGVGALALGLLGGGLLNPSGFARRFETLVGPASGDFRTYAATLAGVAANLQDLWASQPEFWWPWPVTALAWLGLAGAAFARDTGATMGKARLWRLLPAAAGISSLVFFTLVVARRDHRFVLPLGFWLSAYVGYAVDGVMTRVERSGRSSTSRRHRVAMAIPAVLVVIAAARPVSLVATQWGDPRKTVEARLAALPEGARVEAWGRLVYLPRFDDGPYQVHHIHPHRDPRRRPPIPGAELVRADYAELEERSPEVLVVPQEFVSKHIGMSTSGDRVTAEHILRYRRNDAVVDLLQKAVNDELPGYRLALRAEAELPAWMAALGLSPVQIHGSTGRSVWVWRRSGAPQDER